MKVHELIKTLSDMEGDADIAFLFFERYEFEINGEELTVEQWANVITEFGQDDYVDKSFSECLNQLVQQEALNAHPYQLTTNKKEK